MNIGKNVGRIAAVGTYMTGNKLWFFRVHSIIGMFHA